MTDKKSILLIFDLDETLIHSRYEQLDRKPEIIIDPLSVYLRPHTADLIKAAAEHFEVAVWSAGSPVYVRTIVDLIFPTGIKPIFAWNRDHCTQKFEFFPFQILFLKDLSKISEFGFDLAHTLIIEDDPVKIRMYSDNAIIVGQYYGEKEDDELLHLAKFITTLAGSNDVRAELKDGWRPART